MKKHLAIALSFFVISLFLPPLQASQASIVSKKIIHVRPIKLTDGASRITIELVKSKEKKEVTKFLSENQAGWKGTIVKKKAGCKFINDNGLRVTLRDRKDIGEIRVNRIAVVPPVFAGTPDTGEHLHGLRQHYQDWRGTRYRAGGLSHTGVDCSGFTALTFRDVYGIQLPRTAHEQAMRGMPVDRDSLQPGDLVFFKRGRSGDHVGIYLGNDEFMHASSRQGVVISSMNSIYWRGKFWKGSRL